GILHEVRLGLLVAEAIGLALNGCIDRAVSRAGPTFLAMDAPEKIGLVPGMLQHASADTGKLYNLARSLEASRRFAAHRARTRSRLRSFLRNSEGDSCAP